MRSDRSNLPYIKDIKQILNVARNKAYSAVNNAMVEAYWLTGKRIVEEEQNGKERAAYGKEIIRNLSKELSDYFSKTYSERSLRELMQFYQTFPDLLIISRNVTEQLETDFQRTPFAISVNPIWRTLFAKLHWSHYQRVLRIGDPKARMYYLNESAEQNWSINTLDRNISTLYYQRLLSSQIKGTVEDEIIEKTEVFQIFATKYIH